MFLQGAYKIYTESPVPDKVKFSIFCDLRPQNMLLLKQYPAHWCKCITHENFINKLKALLIFYDSSPFCDLVLFNSTYSWYWQGNCEDCADCKKVIVNIDPGKNIFCEEWKYAVGNCFDSHQY